MLDETPGTARAGENPGGGGGGNGALIAIGVIILLGAAGGILWWVGKKEPTPQNQTTTVTSAGTGTTPPPESTVELPPLPTNEPDAGQDVGVDAAETGPKVVTNGGGGGGGSCGGTCAGTVPTELRNFISGRGAAAKLCYRAALEAQEGLAGDITVSLRIASDGSLCSASIVSDSVGNANLATCVKQKMQTSYPAPKGGCVDQRVTINFKPQK